MSLPPHTRVPQKRQPLGLNQGGMEICHRLVESSERYRVHVIDNGVETPLVDCGINVPGSLEAGRLLAEICLGGLGQVRFVPGDRSVWPGPLVQVTTDHPVAACMASQYAGWQVSLHDYFAMGSGPMRAAAGDEEIFRKIHCTESASNVVGVLETAHTPPPAVCAKIADACDVPIRQLMLLVAPTASIAGTVQIAARSVETALHKMFELGFDLDRLICGHGTAPLSPVAADDLAGIGRTNDSILYGGQVTLWITGSNQGLAKWIKEIPSKSSSDYGRPFLEIFEAYDRDFYKVDPHLFSPASVTLMNVTTGSVFQAGELRPDLIQKSFTS